MQTSDALCQPREGHGLQAMMLRWEQLHPVNAMQIAWLRGKVSANAVCAAAERVFRRLRPGSSGQSHSPAASGSEGQPAVFEFQYRPFAGDWRTMLGAAITSDLNNAYDAAASPWRLTLFESPQEGHFLALGYR